MSDTKTRTEVAALLKDNCVLRPLLKDEKPCPKFGPSGTCQDCLYGWEILAQRVFKAIGARRASYEKERDKVKILTAKLEAAEKTLHEVFALFAKIGDGFTAMGMIMGLAKVNLLSSENEKEKVDGEPAKNRH